MTRCFALAVSVMAVAVAVAAEKELWWEKYDQTRPVCGPWLHNASETTMSVTWITRQSVGAGLEYREKGSEKWTRRWKSLYGKMDYTSDVHAFHLTNLKPGTDYEYRLLSQASQYDTHARKTYVGKETYRFKTFDAARGTYSVMLAADIHGDYRDIGKRMYDRLDGKSCDFFVFLGDQVYDNQNQPRYYVTDGYLDVVTKLWGPSKPTVFVRGNHDGWGRHAAESWATYQSRPDNRGYFAFLHGPVFYVVLDEPSEYFKGCSEATTEVKDSYKDDEAAWFRSLPATAGWKKAAFRVVLNHYTTRIGTQPSGWVRKELLPLFNGPDGIHLYICGHEHYHATSLPKMPGHFHDARYDEKGEKPRVYKLSDGTADFTEVCGDKWGGLRLDVATDRMVIRVCDYVRNAIAPDFDCIEIRPDKTARRKKSK